jgi:hypothetical protein
VIRRDPDCLANGTNTRSATARGSGVFKRTLWVAVQQLASRHEVTGDRLGVRLAQRAKLGPDRSIEQARIGIIGDGRMLATVFLGGSVSRPTPEAVVLARACGAAVPRVVTTARSCARLPSTISTVAPIGALRPIRAPGARWTSGSRYPRARTTAGTAPSRLTGASSRLPTHAAAPRIGA